MSAGEAFQMQVEMGVRGREKSREELQADMNEYQKGIAASLASGDIANVFGAKLKHDC